MGLIYLDAALATISNVASVKLRQRDLRQVLYAIYDACQGPSMRSEQKLEKRMIGDQFCFVKRHQNCYRGAGAR
ncbi:MAG TPA: hypothetical protein VFE46_08545 [Pirellulales bacterium]|nr:hypothetical protein [Pirellulales bacterium]